MTNTNSFCQVRKIMVDFDVYCLMHFQESIQHLLDSHGHLQVESIDDTNNLYRKSFTRTGTFNSILCRSVDSQAQRSGEDTERRR